MKLNSSTGHAVLLLLLPIVASQRKAVRTQKQATWNLNAISAPHSQLASSASQAKTYEFYCDSDSDGFGTYAYVLDSGVNIGHSEFQDRAENLWSYQRDPVTNEMNFADETGHGTHVAGIIGSVTFGAAKRTKIINVKVLDSTGSGFVVDLLLGLQHAYHDIMRKGRRGRAVVNVSVGVGCEIGAITDMINKMGLNDIPVVMAAGNDAEDTMDNCVAPQSTAMYVGALTRTWEVGSFSNHGYRIDYFAPGHEIWSLDYQKPMAALKTGTSMAAPHITAIILGYMTANGMNIIEVLGKLQERATYGLIKGDLKNAINVVGHNGNIFQQVYDDVSSCAAD